SNQNLQPGIGRLTAVALTSFIPLNWICKIYSFYASYRIYLSNIRGLRYGVMATRGLHGGRRREKFFARRASPEPHTTGHQLDDQAARRRTRRAVVPPPGQDREAHRGRRTDDRLREAHA